MPITVKCLTCRHVGQVTEAELIKRGIKPDASIASFIRRLRCRRCGSHSVLATRAVDSRKVS
jgi:hypothetical protein